MKSKNVKAGLNLISKLTVGTALGAAAFFIVRSEKPILKKSSFSKSKDNQEELFI